MGIVLEQFGQGEETDEYLMELIGLKMDFPVEANEAYAKLYLRYKEPIFSIALNVTSDIDDAADLVSDTFNMVYNRASTFKIGKAKHPENIRFSILNWMTTIMRHIFYDHYLDEVYKTSGDNLNLEDIYIIEKASIAKHFDDYYIDFVEKLDDNDLENTLPDQASYETENESNNLSKVKEYLNKLSERDKDIVTTSYNYYIPGKYTPAEVLDDLVKRWGTTRENIRQILSKFRKAIKEELQNKIFIRK